MAKAEPTLKVLQVGSGLFDWGGIERYVAYLHEGLTARGHQVSVTAPPGSPLAQRLPTIPIATRRKHDLRAFAAYLKLFKKERFDIVHVHFNPDFLVAARAARIRKQPRIILTRHVALPWSRAKIKLYLPLFDHIIPVSGAVERKLSESGIPINRMTVAKAGCPALTSTTTPDGTFRVGSFGRLVPEKGLEVLIEAARKTPDAQFHLFGNGPLEQALRASAPFNVHLEGFVTDVAEAMGRMSAIAIPSVWEEAFPYSALEAMSLGKPILASKIGGLPEIVEDEKTGLLFPAGDSETLARKTERLSNDADLTQKLGAAGKRIHTETYTVEKMAERIEAVYRAQC